MKTKADGGRGKDGMLNRFTAAMGEICDLTPDFLQPYRHQKGVINPSQIAEATREANKFYKRFTSYKRFKDYTTDFLVRPLPDEVAIGRAFRCTAHAEHGLREITLPTSRASKFEILHILAHYLQPANSSWHQGEFGGIFLDLVEREFDADMKRQVKDILLERRLRTFAKSDASRLRQSEAYHTKKAGQIPQGLVDILADIREIRS